jgi:hypothetical protein
MPSYRKYQWATIPDHMPEQFNKVEWDDLRIKNGLIQSVFIQVM